MTVEVLKDQPNKANGPDYGPDYIEVTKLPSKYKFYQDRVYLRRLTVKEVKRLASYNGTYNDLALILKDVIKPLNIDELALGDLRYIMSLLKVMTFKGSFWAVKNLVCPHCQTVNSTVIGDRDIKFEEVEDDVQLPIVYEADGKVISINDVYRLKHQKVLEELYSENKLTELADNALDILSVIMIDKEEYTQLDKSGKLKDKVVENYNLLSQLPGEVTVDLTDLLDLAYFDISNQFKHTCKSCRKEFDYEFRVGSVETFFPESESRKSIREKVRFGV